MGNTVNDMNVKKNIVHEQTANEVMKTFAIGSSCKENCRFFMFKLVDTSLPFFRQWTVISIFFLPYYHCKGKMLMVLLINIHIYVVKNLGMRTRRDVPSWTTVICWKQMFSENVEIMSYDLSINVSSKNYFVFLLLLIYWNLKINLLRFRNLQNKLKIFAYQ